MLIADVKEVKLRRQKTKTKTTQSKEAKVKGRARKKYPWKSCFSFLYFKFVSAPVLFHFYSVKEVQSVLKTLSISFKITISVSTREKNVCQFTNSAALGISTFALDLAAQICFVLFFQFEFSYLLIKKTILKLIFVFYIWYPCWYNIATNMSDSKSTHAHIHSVQFYVVSLTSSFASRS